MREIQEEYALLLQRLIRHKTISSINDPIPFKNLLNEIKSMFPILVKNSRLEVFEKGFYFLVKGRTNGDPILFMNHHDVVDVKDDWEHDPFAGDIVDGVIHGRGVLDTKGGLFCMLQAIEELLKDDFVPMQDIYLLSTGDEEENGSGAYYISNEFKRRGINFKRVYDEGGMIVADPIMGSDNYYGMVAIGEKPCIDVKFTYHGDGGHAAQPGKNTPIVVISDFIHEVEHSRKFKRKVSAANKLTFKCFAKKMHGILKLVFDHPSLFNFIIKEFVSKVSTTVNAMFKTTVAFTVISGGKSNNVIPNEVSVIANVRIAHHQGIEEVKNILRDYANKYHLEMEVIADAYPSSVTEVKLDGLNVINNALKNAFPDVTLVPYVSNTASDARYFNIVSKQIYGFVPFKISDEQLDSIHGSNESLNIDNLPRAVAFYKNLMRA